MQILKQVTGIDVSKDTLQVCFGTLNQDLKQSISSSIKFSNDLSGHKKLLSWILKQHSVGIPLCFVMEATGVYYENLAFFLTKKGYSACVVLPNKIKNYIRTQDKKSKTDMLDAIALTQFGLEKTLNKWEMPSETMRKLKTLCRDHLCIKGLINSASNRIHAKEHAYSPLKESLKWQKQQISLYKKQEKQIIAKIKELLTDDPELNEKVSKVMTIKGVGLLTVVTLIAETDGFALISNAKQLTSYAGIDVVHNQSGYRTGRTSISKKGNKFIRCAVYMPALCAIRYNDKLKAFYNRLVQKKNIKMIAVTAVMRKILTLIYALWKNNQEYIHIVQS